MSCFQHSPEFFARVLNVLTGPECRASVLSASGLPYSAPDPALRAVVWRWLTVAHLAQGHAYGERYGSRQGDTLRLPSAVPPFRLESWNTVDAVKALTSILYQCAEGDTEDRPEYAATLKTLTDMRNDLAIEALRLHCLRWDASDAWAD